MLTSLKFLFLIVVTLCSVTAVEIHCKYSSFDYFTVGRAYTCAVEQKRDALWADSEVIKIAGDHNDKKKDSDVIAIRVHTRVMHTFPSNFEKFFNNLKAIQVFASKLKVITQKDLQPFVKLQHIDLSRNDLESLEKELFKFNVELLVIKISENKLKFIDATAFDTLFKLHTLELNDNQCIWKSTESRDNWDEEDELTREEVIDVMYEARNRCYRDSTLRELHEMEMGKFLKERSEVVVNLETRIKELTDENDSFYKRMQEYKNDLDVCKMEEIRKSGNVMMMEVDGPKGLRPNGNQNGFKNSNNGISSTSSNNNRGPLSGQNGSVGLTGNSQNVNGYPGNQNRPSNPGNFGSGSNEYDRNYVNNYPGSLNPPRNFNEPNRGSNGLERPNGGLNGYNRPNGGSNGLEKPDGGYLGNSFGSPNGYNNYLEGPNGLSSSSSTYPDRLGNSYSNELPKVGGLNGGSSQETQNQSDSNRHPGGGPNSYLPLNQEMMKNQPPKSGIPIITLIDDPPKQEKSNNRNFDSYSPKNEEFNREERYEVRSNRVDYEQPTYRSQQQHYGPQWDNWGKRDRQNWDRYYR